MHVRNVLRSVFVDQSVREKADLLNTAHADSCNSSVDPCRYVFNNGQPLVSCESSHAVKLGTSLYKDVGVYPELLDILDKTSTIGGRTCLRAILDTPLSDVDALLARQHVLARLSAILDVPSKKLVISHSLNLLRENEPDVAWALHHPHQDEEMRALYDMAFFKMWPLHHLNSVPSAVTALNVHRIVVSPLVGILSPLVYFVIPYLVLRFRVGIKVSLMQYLNLMRASMSVASSMYAPSIQYASIGFSLLFYFQGIFSSIEMAGTLSAICSSICTRSSRISLFQKSADDLVRTCASVQEGIAESFFPPSDNGGRPRCALADRSQYFGTLLTNFKGLDIPRCCSLMRDVYAIDAMVAIIAAKHVAGACDVQFMRGSRPVFIAINLKHPCIPAHCSVPNNMSLHDRVGSSTAALLTGPNAGGKSTLLKSLLLAAIMAQTLTIACCTELQITPYSHIHSHINVPDIQGSKSLFEAEMDRARESIDILANLAPNRFSLIILDEVFSSTNPIEGIAGAYSVAKKLASCLNASLVVSTHFLYLRKLSHLSSSVGRPLFQLVQMPVRIDGASFSYPYRVQTGVCQQLIALELLRAAGFADDVMKDALEIKRTLLAPVQSTGRTRGPLGRRRRNSTPPQPP